MNAPLYSCPHCGANLSLDQLRGTDCPYCGSVFAHHARSVQHAALVNQVMAQNMAAFAMSAPIVPIIPGVPVVHIGAHVEAAHRINNAIAGAVAIAIASVIGLTIVCAVIFA
jgi:hypothetical protein